MKRLTWGETPWDKLSHEELLRTVQRYHSALSSLDSCLTMMRDFQVQIVPDHPYWKEGLGGWALQKSSAILDELHGRYSDEDIYRAFFRYADTLLFPDLGEAWGICPQGHMAAPFKAACPDCQQPMRPLAWSDLAPADHVKV